MAPVGLALAVGWRTAGDGGLGGPAGLALRAHPDRAAAGLDGGSPVGLHAAAPRPALGAGAGAPLPCASPPRPLPSPKQVNSSISKRK